MSNLQAAGIIAAIITGALGTISGIGGLVLSIINYRTHRREQLRFIKVELSMGFIGGRNASEPMLFISAKNPGNKMVTMMSVAILLPNKHQFALLSPKGTVTLPHDLNEGQNCTFGFPQNPLQSA